ncbi:HDIG domain-containing protein [Oscillospiraceae bacterium HV4-5-C5C]|nr:HDIG domain-containing protein [Oscillospiraceae bacterium HV4-5-C5C]
MTAGRDQQNRRSAGHKGPGAVVRAAAQKYSVNATTSGNQTACQAGTLQLRRPRLSLATAVGYTLLFSAMLFLLYYSSRPLRYSVSVGDIATFDITTKQAVEDSEATQKRAEEAANATSRIMSRSSDLSAEALDRLDSFFSNLESVRSSLQQETLKLVKAGQAASLQAAVSPTAAAVTPGVTPAVVTPTPAATESDEYILANITAYYTDSQLDTAATQLVSQVQEQQQVSIETADARALLALEDSVYNSLKKDTLSVADSLMADGEDQASLSSGITEQITRLSNAAQYFKSEYEIAGRLLDLYLKPNLVYDEEATVAARQAEYDRVMANPTLIPAGTRIVNVGDTITQTVYDQLQQLDLIDTRQIDWSHMGGLSLLILLLISLAHFYITRVEQPRQLMLRGDKAVMLVTLLLPLLVSAYLVDLDPLMAPVYYAAIVIAIHFGIQAGLFFSMLLVVAVAPMTYLDSRYLFTAIIGIAATSVAAGLSRKKSNQVVLIAVTSLAPAAAAFTYGLLQKNAAQALLQNTLIAGLTGCLSAVAAIGLMPLYEIFLSSVSPMRLLQLAQPGQPLLRRLFLEAPGTNQHSMMVANLAEAAAEAINADALLARVGSYYHDVGKLEHPEMFTENQHGYNPHDELSPQESVRYIFGHVSAGLKTAKKFRLPLAIQRIITEHHGNTLQASFYYKAKEDAEKQGLPPPDINDFRYPWHIPTSKESGIVMLADSLEAAMKSTKTNNLTDMEALARKIVKIKTEQDQLVDSGLSFAEVEQIIQAFVQVYQGQFHERVKYPDENKPKRPAAIISTSSGS